MGRTESHQISTLTNIFTNMITNEQWQKANRWEEQWWSDCTNTYGEETKQLEYAKLMGLSKLEADMRPYFDLQGKSIIDIGGGPSSLLFKCINRNVQSFVIEPMIMPDWVYRRYHLAGIKILSKKGEDAILDLPLFDECWIYNVLQHTQNPKKIIENAKSVSKLIRIFEWIDTPAHDGHPQTLKETELNEWLGGIGRVYDLSKEKWGSYTKAYAGIFPTENYGKVEIE